MNIRHFIFHVYSLEFYDESRKIIYLSDHFLSMIMSGSESKTRAYIWIHLAVVLFGFTAILGDLIELSAVVLVWWRVFITSGSLLFLFSRQELLKLSQSGNLLKIWGIGIIVSLHWLCFYGAIKTSNASVALVCMSMTSLFTAFIEPLVHGTRVSKKDVIFSVLMIPCFILVANHVPDHYSTGLLLGVAAAFLAAVFSVLNKKYIQQHNVYAFTFIELFSATVFLGVFLILNTEINMFEEGNYLPDGIHQWLLLLTLALLCTTLAYILSLKALKYLSAFTANMVINLEPVYGILLAILILGNKEYMNVSFYLGALLITVLVFLYPFLFKKKT